MASRAPADHPAEVLDRVVGHGVMIATPDKPTRRPSRSHRALIQARLRSRPPRRRWTRQNLTLPDRLGRIAWVLSGATVILQRARSAECDHLVRVLRAARATLDATTDTLHSRTLAGVPAALPERLDDWLHEVNNPLTVIAGWASMLSPTTDAARYTRAIEAIDLNTKRLTELLGHPPV